MILGRLNTCYLQPLKGKSYPFSTLAASTRVSIEAQYLGFILSNLSNPFHGVTRQTTPFVAFIEAAGIFSERFFFFSKRVEPTLSGVALRSAFFQDELGPQRLCDVLVDPYVNVGTRDNTGLVIPNFQGNDIEGAVYGAIYLDFASRIGLWNAVGLVLESNATNFDEFKQHAQGRGNDTWQTAINAVACHLGNVIKNHARYFQP